MMIPKPAKPFRSKKYLDWVASLPCCISQRPSGPAHHLLRGVDKCGGRKSSDYYAIPLAPDMHQALHRDGNETRFLAQYGIYGPTLAKQLFAVWEDGGDYEQAVRVVRGPQAAE